MATTSLKLINVNCNMSDLCMAGYSEYPPDVSDPGDMWHPSWCMHRGEHRIVAGQNCGGGCSWLCRAFKVTMIDTMYMKKCVEVEE